MPSTVIRSFTYDVGTRELRIVFQTGRRYIYQDVPPEVFAELKASYSKGEYFNARIRGQFPFARETDAA